MNKGILEINRLGFGFIRTKEKDYYVAKNELKNFIDNDLVSFNIVKKEREEAKKLKLLKRETISGIVFKEGKHCILKFKNSTINLKNGSKYLEQFVKVEYINQEYVVTESLGHISQEKIENQVVINNYQIPNHWNSDLENELLDVNLDQTEEFCFREDYRNVPFITIDGEYSKDFDDAVYCNKTETGFDLFVAIADVSYYVKQDGFLDKEAFNRGNSVYFSNEVIPMLPEKLSNDLCSLVPNEDRLALVCEMKFNSNGYLKKFIFKEGVISSKQRCTYNEVFKYLETTESNYSEEVNVNILNLNNLYQILKKKRNERGALNFESKEGRVIFDDNSKIKEFVVEERNEAHKIIEECMLIANVCAAKLLDKNKIPSLYRNHPTPNEEKIKDLREFLKGFGLDVRKEGKNIQPMYYKILLDKLKNSEFKEIIEKNVLRSLSKAVYEVENSGHFGLGYDKYTHFTSPIRRYTDLIIHRNIKYLIRTKNINEVLNRKNDFNYNIYDNEKLLAISEQVNMTERRANDSTQEAYELLVCYYLKNNNINENKINAKIVHFTNTFMFVELEDYLIEGIIFYKDLKGYFKYIKEKEMIISNNKKYQLGETIKVKIKEINYNERKAILKIS